MKRERILSLCLASLLILSLAACKGQAEEQDSAPPTASVQPTPKPTPTPEPTPPIPYTDVPEDAPYYDAVVWAYENGIASDGDTFEPDSVCTRGQVITFLWRAMGSPEPWIMENPFDDASPDAWYYKPALWAYQHSIATSTTVNPGNPCTSAEALTFLWRAEGKPMAAVGSSVIALAAPSQYFTRPVAWAETNGLLSAEVGFDPSASCLRADLMTYLYWAAEEWTFSEEDKALQAEYEQIIYGSEYLPYYADYVDVDGDGEQELLTLSFDGRSYIATVYSNIDGHAEEYAESKWGSHSGTFSIYQADGKVYLCDVMLISDSWYKEESYIFWEIENGDFVYADSATKSVDSFLNEYSYQGYLDFEITEEEYNAILQKYTNKREILRFDSSGISVLERGIAPSWDECTRYWTAHWAASDLVYAAVLKGDFSAFAGTYSAYSDMNLTLNDLTLDKNGILTGDDFILAIKPSSISVSEDGVIHCELATREDEVGHTYEGYGIYPVGVDAEFIMEENYQDNPNIVRIIYKYPTHGVDQDLFTKVS